MGSADNGPPLPGARHTPLLLATTLVYPRPNQVADLTLKPLEFDPRSAGLTPEEGFVLSRIDQPVFARDLAAMTGLPKERVERIVARLLEVGAIGVHAGGEAVRRSITHLAAVHPEAPTVPAPPRAPVPPSRPPKPPASRRHPSERQPSSAPRLTPVTVHAVPTRSDASDSGTHQRPAATPPPATEGLSLFQREFASLSPTERANRAQRADGDDLVALCHDPHPQVIHALMANPRFTSRFARLVALYHKNPSGLELLARNRELVVDPKVQLCLLLNPHLTAPILERLMSKATLGDLHRLAADTRIPEDVRRRLLNQLRERFNAASGEERVELVYWSDGRVLQLLRGCTFDERTTSLLAKRTYTSEELVRQLATFPATPPALLRALLRQALVQERPDLRELVAAHPHAPRVAAGGTD